ncbi:MAG: GIY-YIG nuclease family protein [Exilibacterium sp.]
MSPQPTTSWCVYIIQSDDDLLYTGITNNLERRWQAHLQQMQGLGDIGICLHVTVINGNI